MKKAVYTLLIVIFSLVFVISAFFIISYYTESRRNTNDYENLANQLVTATEAAMSDETPEGQTAPQKDDSYRLVEVALPDGSVEQVMWKYSKVYPQNTDMVGWLTIPDTVINYPVMHTPEDPEYYLNRNFKKEETKAGSLFVQASCNALAPSDNVVIYGHNMKDGSMFHGLEQYKELQFWKEHKTIIFNTIYEPHTYEVMAVFKAEGGFAYYNFDYAENEQEFDAFVQKCKSLSLYETGVNAAYGDKLITLSTCEYSQTNGRFVVVAKRVD